MPGGGASPRPRGLLRHEACGGGRPLGRPPPPPVPLGGRPPATLEPCEPSLARCNGRSASSRTWWPTGVTGDRLGHRMVPPAQPSALRWLGEGRLQDRSSAVNCSSIATQYARPASPQRHATEVFEALTELFRDCVSAHRSCCAHDDRRAVRELSVAGSTTSAFQATPRSAAASP